MSGQLHIYYPHGLSYAQALALMQQWQAEGVEKFGLNCQAQELAQELILEISMPGLSGCARTTPEVFVLDVELGFLLKPFKEKIDAQVRSNIARGVERSKGLAAST